MITLINPPLLSTRGDSHSSGIPYLPHGLAYVSSALDKVGLNHEVIDCFGERPNRASSSGRFLMFGIPMEELFERVLSKPQSAIILYANSVFNSYSVFEIARGLKKLAGKTPIIVTENTQAVTGFSLMRCLPDLMDSPISHAILGESEQVLPLILPSLLEKGTIPPELQKFVWSRGESAEGKTNAIVEDLDALPIPGWHKFPLKNYWGLKYAHGPTSGPYLALLTSRGCPYPCGFCSVPVMNNRKWRMRSASNVVNEIAYLKQTFGVEEFHWEDLNPTIHEKRMEAISNQLIERKLNIRWRIVSGTKMDNLKIETLRQMAQSGMDYISFSPESGSPRMLKKIMKPFQHDHAVNQVEALTQMKVMTQACFVLGYPGEEEGDREATFRYSKDLLKKGLGEVTYFIVAPMPGTPIENQIPGSFHELSDLTFSPSWRTDYPNLLQWRNRLYRSFFAYRIFSTPLFFLKSCGRALTGKTRLKMEMFPRRRIKTWIQEKRLGSKLPPRQLNRAVNQPEGGQVPASL